jgi:hypothetical protein
MFYFLELLNILVRMDSVATLKLCNPRRHFQSNIPGAILAQETLPRIEAKIGRTRTGTLPGLYN